jgi:threonine/homoserine/homoserine lactone efflux protein
MKFSIKKTNRLLLEGLKIGFLLQIGSIGPICMLVFRLSLSLPVSKLLIGVVSITLSDLIYTFLAVLSVSAMKKIQQYQRILDIIVGIILIVFGVLFITTGNAVNFDTLGGHNLFLWLFGLNMANPITIVFIAGIFLLEIGKRDMNLKDASIFGFGFLLTTPIFMIGIIIIGKFAGAILPDIVVQMLNIIMGIVLVFLGAKTIFFKKKSVEGGKKCDSDKKNLENCSEKAKLF